MDRLPCSFLFIVPYPDSPRERHGDISIARATNPSPTILPHSQAKTLAALSESDTIKVGCTFGVLDEGDCSLLSASTGRLGNSGRLHRIAKKSKFHAVVQGGKLGIFNTWERGARLSIERFPEAKHQSFATLELAEEWYRLHSPAPGSNHSSVIHFSTEGMGKQRTAAPQQAALNGIGAKRYVIYLIIDPATEEPFYVGLTTDLERRKRAHLGRAKHNTKRAAAKIAEILDAGMRPIFKAVESCDSEQNALAAETRWVEQCTIRGYVVWNRWKEHQDIQEVRLKPKLDLNQIIGDGPTLLGPYPYKFRFELKKRLSAFLMKFSSGVINHPMAMEKLKLIWTLTRHAGE